MMNNRKAIEKEETKQNLTARVHDYESNKDRYIDFVYTSYYFDSFEDQARYMANAHDRRYKSYESAALELAEGYIKKLDLDYFYSVDAII